MHFLDFESKERHLLVLTLMSKSMVQCVLLASSMLKDEVQTLSVLFGDGFSCRSHDADLRAILTVL